MMPLTYFTQVGIIRGLATPTNTSALISKIQWRYGIPSTDKQLEDATVSVS